VTAPDDDRFDEELDDAEQAEAWRLAEEFDRSARTDGAEPDPEFLAAVATSMDDEVLFALLDELDGLCLGEDEHLARRYGDHLASLASLLPDEARRAVLAGVDLSLAELCGYAHQWEEAKLRADRAGPDVAALLPGLVADWEAVLAGYADHEGRTDDARGHWARARDLLADAERWGEAACAGESVAEHHGVSTVEALADWRRAADLFVAAGKPVQARECVEQACGWLGQTMQSMVSGDELTAMVLADTARAMALEHGLLEIATHLGQIAATMAIETSDPWEVLAERFDKRRAEYRALGLNAADRRVQLAMVDLAQGMAAVTRNRPFDGERLLADALGVFREAGLTAEVEMCESELMALLNSTRPPVDAFDPPLDQVHWSDPETLAGTRMMAALRLAAQGRIEEAVASLAEASRLAIEGGAPNKAVGADGFAALLRLVTGDRSAAGRSAEQIDHYLAENTGQVPRSGVVVLSCVSLMLRAEFARAEGDGQAQLAHLEQLEDVLVSLDARLPAGLTALQRARILLDTGHPREALRLGLPAVLALDTLRCTLPDARRRIQWTTAVAHGFDTAFRSAAACADTRVLAELLEVTRGNAVPLPRAADARDDAVSALGALLTPNPTPADASATHVALFGAHSAAGGEERTALGLPAYIRAPWDTIALAEHLQRARHYLDPVRANVAVDWRIREVSP